MENKNLSDKKVLLIAGSPICLQKKRDLSNYDIIVKMNAFPLAEEYNEYVSERCDIWITTEYILWGLMDQLEERRKKVNEIYFINSPRNLANICMKDRIQLENFKNSHCTKIYKFNNPLKINRCPTIGLVALYFLMSKYSDITILGFTFGEGTNHFYDNIKKSENHDFVQEKSIFENCIKEKKIKVID
tara:strand:- start:11119 stop:11682 length:564 start_codon:yes stop_codon:yes gene_type:complete